MIKLILDERSAGLVPIVSQLTEALESGSLTQPASELYRSFVHMHCNRLLGTDPETEKKVLGLLKRTREALNKAPIPRKI